MSCGSKHRLRLRRSLLRTVEQLSQQADVDNELQRALGIVLDELVPSRVPQSGDGERPDNNASSQLMRYRGLPTSRAPDAPWSRSPSIQPAACFSQPAGSVTESYAR